MNFRKSILALSLASFSFGAFANAMVAPANRIRIWEGSAVSFNDLQYTIGTTSAMGVIKTLKSNPTVENLLKNLNIAANAGALDMSRSPGANLSSVNFNGIPHQRLSDVGLPSGQCVAFARSMTGAPTSDKWYTGRPLTDFIDITGRLKTTIQVFPGTMIAYFRGKSQYPQRPENPEDAGHVAIFLSWVVDGNGIVVGASVVDENLISTVAINGKNVDGAAGLIQKHFLPWRCPVGQTCSDTNWKYNVRYFSSNYHVVDVR